MLGASSRQKVLWEKEITLYNLYYEWVKKMLKESIRFGLRRSISGAISHFRSWTTAEIRAKYQKILKTVHGYKTDLVTFYRSNGRFPPKRVLCSAPAAEHNALRSALWGPMVAEIEWHQYGAPAWKFSDADRFFFEKFWSPSSTSL